MWRELVIDTLLYLLIDFIIMNVCNVKRARAERYVRHFSAFIIIEAILHFNKYTLL